MNWEEKYLAIVELVDGYRRERDEARAEVERLRRMLPVHPSSLTDACTDAYRRGAEAMREACARVIDVAEADPRPCVKVSDLARDIRSLPIPEDP